MSYTLEELIALTDDNDRFTAKEGELKLIKKGTEAEPWQNTLSTHARKEDGTSRTI